MRSFADSHRNHRRRGQLSLTGRSGFTLIEVLVALALSLVLISAIYSAVSLHWRYETLGRERIDRAQVSLAILRLLSEDVGSVAFTAPKGPNEEESAAVESAETAAKAAGTSATPAQTKAVTSKVTSANTVGASTSTFSSLGIVGTTDVLQLDISQPAREDFIPTDSTTQPASTTTAEATPSAESDQVRVKWGMARPLRAPDSATGPRALVANPALAREMADRLWKSFETDEDTTSSSLNTPLDESSILAREVVSLRFRYYDGYSWVSEWNSTTRGRLPRAIEVTFGFLKPEYKPSGSLNLPGQEEVVLIKHVILVPLSSPVAGDEI